MTNTNLAVTDPRAKRWGSIAKWLFLIFGFAVMAPFVWLAVGGLIGFILLFVVWTATWMLRPYVYDKAANIRLMLIRREAMKNPIETLLNTYRERCNDLDRRKTAIEQFYGAILNMQSKVNDIAEKYGKSDKDYIKLSTDAAKLLSVYKLRCEKWKEASNLLSRFKEEIERANMIWEAGCAAAAAKESSGYTEADFFIQLKTDTAFDSIDANYNAALASLDTALLDAPTNQTK